MKREMKYKVCLEENMSSEALELITILRISDDIYFALVSNDL